MTLKRLGSDHYFNNCAFVFAETGSLNHFWRDLEVIIVLAITYLFLQKQKVLMTLKRRSTWTRPLRRQWRWTWVTIPLPACRNTQTTARLVCCRAYLPVNTARLRPAEGQFLKFVARGFLRVLRFPPLHRLMVQLIKYSSNKCDFNTVELNRWAVPLYRVAHNTTCCMW